MKTTLELLREGRNQEIWTRHCGYLDLSIDEFMSIQKRLLMEQIGLLSESKIGQALFKGKPPKTIDEFRARVPLTRYDFYAPYLQERNDDGLPAKAHVWLRTSGRTSGDGHFKWVPYTKAMYEKLGGFMVTGILLSSAKERGDISTTTKDRILLATAPRPYLSGHISFALREQLGVRFLPSLEEGEQMEFVERIAKGMRMAIEEGMDYFFGLSSILVRIGEQFEESTPSSKPSIKLFNPAILWRLLRAAATAKFHNRNLLPKDIWKIKGIITGGADASVYRKKIKHYWGRIPLESYTSSEGSTMAAQTWNYKDMTFAPDNAFLEFIPLDEHIKSKADPAYIPKTILYDEVKPGIYEIVFTNFHGGVFTRYRIGDLLRVTKMSDEELNINQPQFEFYSSVSDVIDLSGLVRLTEKDIWNALEKAEAKYKEWTVRKEFENTNPILHLYIEPKPSEEINIKELTDFINDQLTKINPEYADFQRIIGRNPLKISILRNGSFEAFMKYQMEMGADLAHIKPRHMQPSDEIMMKLINPDDKDS